MEKKILLVCSSKGAVNYHRMIVPHARLAQLHGVKIEHTIDDRAWINEDPRQLHAIVFTRMINLDGIEYGGKDVPLEALVNIFKSYGVKFILDIDDWWVLDKHHILYEKYGDWYAEQTIRSIKLADLVITTNKRLKKKIRAESKKVTIIPNCINLDEPQWQQTLLPENTTFGYFGGQTHKEDVASMQTSMVQFKAYAFDKMYFSYGFEILDPKDEFGYGELYDKVSVSLAPILHTPFNVCKSNLKIMEAAAKGRWIACTDIAPYSGFESVAYFGKDVSWEDGLQNIAIFEDIEKRAKELQEEVKDTYNLDQWTKERFKLYKNL